MDICHIQRRKTGKFLQTCIKEARALSQRSQDFCSKTLSRFGAHLPEEEAGHLKQEACPCSCEDNQAFSKRCQTRLRQGGPPKLVSRASFQALQEVWRGHCFRFSVGPRSSQEILASQASAAPPDVNYKQYTCSRAWPSFDSFLTAPNNCHHEGGPGSSPWLVFYEEEHESEISNSMVLAMDPKVKKAAKAAAKAAAMALKRLASKALLTLGV